MRRPRPLTARGAGDERGFTLVELLVAMVVALLVFGAGATFMVVAFHQENIVSSRTTATNQAEQGLEQLVRDLREATTSVTISNPTGSTTQIAFSIPTPGTAGLTPEAVTWTCASSGVGTCVRVLGSGGTANTKTLIRGVQSMVFTPTYGGTATTPTNATDIASVAMKLTVRVLNYGLTANGAVTTAAAGTASAPIVLQATADLRNFS